MAFCTSLNAGMRVVNETERSQLLSRLKCPKNMMRIRAGMKRRLLAMRWSYLLRNPTRSRTTLWLRWQNRQLCLCRMLRSVLKRPVKLRCPSRSQQGALGLSLMFILMLPVRSTFRFPRRCPCLRLAPHGVRQAPRRRGLALHRRRGPALHPPQPLLVLLRARQPPGPPRGLHRRDRKEVEDQALPAPRNPVLPLLLRAPCRRPLRLPYRLLRRRLLHRRPLFPRAFRVREKRNEGPFRAVAHLLGLGTFVIRVPCENSVGDC